MKHSQTYNMKELKTAVGAIVIEGPVSSQTLQQLDFHEQLTAFRPPEQQKKH